MLNLELLRKLGMTVELGKSYKNNSQEIVEIVFMDEYDKNVFLDNFGRSYRIDGKYFYENSKYDLLEEI